jgi:hypothetical protein
MLWWGWAGPAHQESRSRPVRPAVMKTLFSSGIGLGGRPASPRWCRKRQSERTCSSGIGFSPQRGDGPFRERRCLFGEEKNTYRLAKTKQPRRNDTWMNSGHIKDRSPVITRAFNMPFCNAKHVRTHYTATIMHTPMKAATPSRPEDARSSYDVARSSYNREDRENLVRGICGPKLGDKYINWTSLQKWLVRLGSRRTACNQPSCAA